jgi:hypothetical protein
MDAALLAAAPGLRFLGCEVGEGPLGRGCMASRTVGNVPAGDPVVRVPVNQSVALCVDGAHDVARSIATRRQREMGVPDELLRALDPNENAAAASAAAAASSSANSSWSLTASERMGVLLHWATAPNRATPRMAAYASTLPTASELSVGALFDADETSWLQDAALEARCASARARHRVVAEETRSRLGGILSSDDDDDDDDDDFFALSLARASSRTFGALNGALGLMCPGADMMNHAFGPSCNFRVVNADGDAPTGEQLLRNSDDVFFELYAVRGGGGVRAGEELFISYGEELTNAELMMNYGFAVPRNPNEVVPLGDGGGGGGGGGGCGGGGDVSVLDAIEPPEDGGDDRVDAVSKAAGDAARVGSDADAVAYAVAARRALKRSARAAAANGDARVVAAADAVERALAGAPTTLDEDLALLAGGGASRSCRTEAATWYRVERKRLLHASLAVLTTAARRRGGG